MPTLGPLDENIIAVMQLEWLYSFLKILPQVAYEEGSSLRGIFVPIFVLMV